MPGMRTTQAIMNQCVLPWPIIDRRLNHGPLKAAASGITWSEGHQQT
jgi:hypothetical protein